MMTEADRRRDMLYRARQKYIPAKTKNISVALELYLNNDATKEERVPLVITRKSKPTNWVDKIGRPKCPNCDIGLSLNLWKGLWQCDLCEFKRDIKIKKCPECDGVMNIVPVNISKCTQVDGNYNSAWTCKDKDCMNTTYNKETMQEILMEEKANGIS